MSLHGFLHLIVAATIWAAFVAVFVVISGWRYKQQERRRHRVEQIQGKRELIARWETTRRRREWLARSRPVHERDLNKTITLIRGMDPAEIGLVLAVAADARNGKTTLNDALLDLYALEGQIGAMWSFVMSRRIQEFQRQNHYLDAAAWTIWLHTVRAAEDRQLRYLAKQMWSELERGFPYVEDCAREYEAAGKGTLMIVRGTEFPKGLNPHL
jgi:hypothetical protein